MPSAFPCADPRSRVLAVLTRWLTVLAGLCALGTLLGFAGERWWLLDLCSHFRLQYFLCLVLAVPILVLRRRPLPALLFAAAAALNAAVVLPAWIGERADAVPNLRVLVLNLAAGNQRADLVIPYLQAVQADVVVLVEFTPFWHNSLTPLHAAYPERIEVPAADPFGLALYSRLPCAVGRAEAVSGIPRITARLVHARGEITVFALHPPPPINALLSRDRDEYLSSAADAVRATPGAVIVAGDLNATPWSYGYRILRAAGLRTALRPLATWPAFLPWPAIPIDHVLVAGPVGLAGGGRGPAVGSDHFPLVSDLAVLPQR